MTANIEHIKIIILKLKLFQTILNEIQMTKVQSPFIKEKGGSEGFLTLEF